MDDLLQEMVLVTICVERSSSFTFPVRIEQAPAFLTEAMSEFVIRRDLRNAIRKVMQKRMNRPVSASSKQRHLRRNQI